MENGFQGQKKVNVFMILTAVFGGLFILTLIFGIFQLVENAKLKDENGKLKTEVATLEEASSDVSKRVLKGNSTKKSVEFSEEGVATTESGTANVVDSKKYLEPKDWDVRFAYPEGVTDIAYALSTDNFDGAMYITGIAKGGKVYDVNICGGKAAYEQYPFFLGEVDRWNPTGTHEEWNASSPSTYDGMKRILKTGGIEYYVNTYYGNGCETGDETPDYVEATKLAKEILESIEKK